MIEVTVAGVGLMLVILGFSLAFIAVILLAVKSAATGGRTPRWRRTTDRSDPNNIRNGSRFGQSPGDSSTCPDCGRSSFYSAPNLAVESLSSMTAPLCALCGTRAATYVCQSCGRTACGSCFNPAHWACTDCLRRTTQANPAGYGSVSQFSKVSWLFFIAFAIIFVGILLMTIESISNLHGISGGAIILIGPIPIVLGNGPYSTWLVILAVILTVFSLALYLGPRKRT